MRRNEHGYKANNQTPNGIGFCDLLAIVFITLKHVEVIGWSWGWVLDPVWRPVVVGIEAAAAVFILVALWGAWKAAKDAA
jgi:hypothetical protein